LAQHQIAVYPLTQDWQYEQTQFRAGQSYYVPLQQSQYRLLKAAFSTEKTFNDNTFYDVSAWTLPYAFNIQFTAVNREPGRALAEQAWQLKPRSRQMTPQADGYAYVLNWQDQLAPVALQAMLAEGLIVRAALGDFTGSTPQGSRSFKAGAMVVPAGLQQHPDWFFRLQKVQERFNLPIYTLTTGLTSRGSDLGSNTFIPVQLPQVLLVAGPGINSTEAGEVWYNLERLAGISPTMVEPERLSRINLSRYTHIILPDGDYRNWQETETNRLRQWAQQGGILWGHKRGAAWLVEAKLLQAGVWSGAEMNKLITEQNLKYADKEALAGRQRIAGAIFNAELDLTHPLTFGIRRKDLPVFKNSNLLLQPSAAPFVNVALYTNQSHLAGFTSSEYLPRIAQGAVMVAHNLGRGRVIGMTDNPVFRGYFKGSSRLLINALYLGQGFSAAPQAEE
jgi:hypothetical protein